MKKRYIIKLDDQYFIRINENGILETGLKGDATIFNSYYEAEIMATTVSKIYNKAYTILSV